MKWVLFFLDFLIVCVLWFNKIFVFIITIIIIMHKTFIKLHFSDPIALTDESITVKARAWRWSFLTGGIWGCLHPADSPADSGRTSLSWAADAAVADPGKGQRSKVTQSSAKVQTDRTFLLAYTHMHVCKCSFISTLTLCVFKAAETAQQSVQTHQTLQKWSVT